MSREARSWFQTLERIERNDQSFMGRMTLVAVTTDEEKVEQR